jgi:UDPglucose 6-dehydrogenase
LAHVLAAADLVGRAIERDVVVVVKSTVPVGTCDRVREVISGALADRNLTVDLAVASNPEFLKEGNALEDFQRPDRIIIGTADQRAVRLLRALYAPYNRQKDRLIEMDTRSSEFTKYAANAMLATRISLMNEFARLAERVGADIEAVRHGIGSDPRIGPSFLYAGAGYGGSCFPKDTLALIKTGQDHAAPLRIVETVAAVNDTRKRAMARKVVAALGSGLRGKTVAVLGLTFKPNTDDMREAPSIPLITALHDMGALVRAYDPIGMDQARQVLPDVTYTDGPYECVEGADALVIVTEWEQFRALDLDRIKQAMAASPVIVDLRNIYHPEEITERGFVYESVGRAKSP